jgi:hypothetical protein
MKSRAIRSIGPFVAAVALALVIDTLAKATSWDAGWTYALAGFGAALLLLVGTPFAFGRTLRFSTLQTSAVAEVDEALARDHGVLDLSTAILAEHWNFGSASSMRSTIFYQVPKVDTLIELKQPYPHALSNAMHEYRPESPHTFVLLNRLPVREAHEKLRGPDLVGSMRSAHLSLPNRG